MKLKDPLSGMAVRFIFFMIAFGIILFVGIRSKPDKLVFNRDSYILELNHCKLDDSAWCLDEEDAVRLQMILSSYREDNTTIETCEQSREPR